MPNEPALGRVVATLPPVIPTIRPFQAGDESACRALWVELTQHHRDIYAAPSIGEPDPGSGWDDLSEDARLAGVWVAEIDSEIVGMTGLLLEDGDAEVEPVIVSERHRGRGVGSRLLETVIDEARRQRAAHLKIRPVARNSDAIRAFHRAGFTTLGHVDMFMDLREAGSATWKSGVQIHGLNFDH